ncbi:Sec1-like protein [Martensiomyces pterosporus]|nr:Sec1-like protein [Martensiomyces pterosporus]
MDSSDEQPRSMIELLRKTIIDAIAAIKTSSRWRVVVVDRPSLKIISSVLKMPAVLDQNVVAVQLITRSRQPYPDMDAIYILVPCADSISRVINDFSHGQAAQDREQRHMYAHAYLLFTGALSDSLFGQLSASAAAQHIRGIRELFIEYNPIESRAFLTAPSATPFYTLYSAHAADRLTADLDAAADRLLSVIASLRIKPYIRYYRPGLSSEISVTDMARLSPHVEWAGGPRIAEAMANRLQLKLDDYYSHEKRKLGKKDGHPPALSPSVVIILDRSIDLYAPFIHEFTYQAMVSDLVDLQDGEKYVFDIETKSGERRKVEAELTERADPLWEKLRHMHIAEATQALTDKFNKLIEEHVGITAIQEKSKTLSLSEMRRVLSEIPEFKKLQASYSSHISIANRCLNTFQEHKIELVSELEQSMVTGATGEGAAVDRMTIETQLITLLDDKAIEVTDRMRLLLLYLVYADGATDVDRRRLQEVPQCLTKHDKCAAINLRDLGIQPGKELEDGEGPGKQARYKWNALHSVSSSHSLARFVPAVKRILQVSAAPWPRLTGFRICACMEHAY